MACSAAAQPKCARDNLSPERLSMKWLVSDLDYDAVQAEALLTCMIHCGCCLGADRIAAHILPRSASSRKEANEREPASTILPLQARQAVWGGAVGRCCGAVLWGGAVGRCCGLWGGAVGCGAVLW